MILSAILIAFAAFLGLAMELYKKSLRRDKQANMRSGRSHACSALLAFVTYRVAPAATPAGN